MHRLLERIGGKVKGYLKCEEASIFIFNPQREELYFEIVTGEKGKILKEIVLKKGEGIAGWIVENREPLIINDCNADPRFAAQIDRQAQFQTRSIAGAPVLMGETILGVIEAINKTNEFFTKEDLHILGAIARFIAIPLQNAILFRSILRESREKEDLIKLGKIIASSFDYNDIFANFLKIISDVFPPASVHVYIKESDTLHDLLKGSSTLHPSLEQTIPFTGGERLRIPLETVNSRVGHLEFVGRNRLPESAVSLLRGLASFLAIAVEKTAMNQQVIEKEKMARELQIARDIQQSFLQKSGSCFEGMDIDFRLIASSAVGGDYYEVLQLPGQKILIGMNDVSGHGVPASLVMSIFRSNFVYQVKKGAGLHETMNHINDLLVETTDSNLFVTSFTGIINLQQMQITYINAGHPSPMILRPGDTKELKANSMVIGIMGGIDLEPQVIEIEQGDILVLFTDGLLEAENPNEEMFGPERLAELILSHRNSTAAQLTDLIIEELRRFTGGEQFSDDVTLMIVKIL